MRAAARAGQTAALLPLLLLLAAPAPAQHESAPDVPAGPATLRGRVLEQGSDEPVAGASVALYALTRQGTPGLRRTVTDAAGAFVFEGLSNDPDVAYLVGARFEGVAYPGERVLFAGEQLREVEIRVAPVVSSAAKVRLVERTLRLDPRGGSLAVDETLVLENAGPSTVFVGAQARAGASPVLRVPLPEGRSDFRMPFGVIPDGAQVGEDAFVFWGPVYPGRQELTWTYTLEATRSETSDELHAQRFVWRAPLEPDAAPLWLELPAGETRVTAAGASLEPADDGPSEADLRRLRVRPTPGEDIELVVRTPPARVDPDAVRLVEAQLVLHADAAAVQVNETHVLEVEGTQRLRAAPEQPLYRIPVPPRAADLRFGSDAADATLRPDPEGGLAVSGTLAPGETRVELAYRLPVASFPTHLAWQFAVRLPLLSVYVAETGSLAPTSARLHRRRPVRSQDLVYSHFEAFEVAAGKPVDLSIEQIPPRLSLPRLAWLGLGGGLAVATVAFLMAPVWRARDPGRLEAEPVPRASVRERQQIYEAIADLDHDFETGKVSAEDHARLRAELRQRAVALLAEERAARTRAWPSAPASPAEANAAEAQPEACASCGAVPRPDDRFCGRCGRPLAAPDRQASGASSVS